MSHVNKKSERLKKSKRLKTNQDKSWTHAVCDSHRSDYLTQTGKEVHNET